MNKEELIGKLQMVYVGDKNALNEMIDYYGELFDEMSNWREEVKELKKQLKKKNKPQIFIACEASRFQEQNRKIALERIESKIISAVKINKKRIKTKPTIASKENRLKTKKLKSLLKQQRAFKF